MTTFRSSLPALLFFVLLGGAVAAGWALGASRAATDTRLFTCSMHPQVRHEGPGLCPICHMELVPTGSVTKDDGPAITIDPVVVQNMGVRVVPVQKGELTRDLRLFGTLQVAQDHLRDITLKFGGFVEKLHASRDGMAIAIGDPLFELYAPDLVVAEERLIAAVRGGEEGPLQAARLRLERWDVPESIIEAVLKDQRAPRTIVWPSPIAGIVVQRNLTQGGRVEAGANVLRVADLTTLWLDAQVPESQLAAVRIGMTATAELQAEPGVQRPCTVTLIAPIVDERTRTATVRLELANTDGKLMPGMFARVHLHAAHVPNALLVPREAVLDTGLRQLAWVALGNGRFEPREVQLGANGDGGVVQVLQGLAEGEPVVVSGQFLIDAESRLRESTRKFANKDLLPAGPLPSTAAAAALDAPAQQAVDAAFTAYLAVQTAFAADRDDAALWQALQTAATPLATALPESLRALGTALTAALQVDAKDLAARRTAFAAVSQQAIALFERARPSASFGKELFVMHCSMKTASWLQVGPTMRNPYYGSEMLECGEVQRTLPTGDGGSTHAKDKR